MNLKNMLFDREFLESDGIKIKKTTAIFDIVEYLSVVDYEKIKIGENDEY